MFTEVKGGQACTPALYLHIHHHHPYHTMKSSLQLLDALKKSLAPRFWVAFLKIMSPVLSLQWEYMHVLSNQVGFLSCKFEDDWSFMHGLNWQEARLNQSWPVDVSSSCYPLSQVTTHWRCLCYELKHSSSQSGPSHHLRSGLAPHRSHSRSPSIYWSLQRPHPARQFMLQASAGFGMAVGSLQKPGFILKSRSGLQRFWEPFWDLHCRVGCQAMRPPALSGMSQTTAEAELGCNTAQFENFSSKQWPMLFVCFCPVTLPIFCQTS